MEVAEPLGELSDDVSGGHFGLSFHEFVDIRFGDLVQAERLEALVDEVVACFLETVGGFGSSRPPRRQRGENTLLVGREWSRNLAYPGDW